MESVVAAINETLKRGKHRRCPPQRRESAFGIAIDNYLSSRTPPTEQWRRIPAPPFSHGPLAPAQSSNRAQESTPPRDLPTNTGSPYVFRSFLTEPCLCRRH